MLIEEEEMKGRENIVYENYTGLILGLVITVCQGEGEEGREEEGRGRDRTLEHF